MKTNYKIIFPLLAILFAFSNCTKKDKNDPCILSVDIVKTADLGGGQNELTAVTSGGLSPYTYQWSNGVSGSNVILVAGTVTVLVTDAVGCTATDTYDYYCEGMSVELEVENTLPDGTVELQAQAYNGSQPYAYQWTNGTVIISDNYNSRYAAPWETVSVEVTDSIGCNATATYTNCPCQNGGTCAGDTCQCPLGYFGDSCQYHCRGCTSCGTDTTVTDAEGNVYDIVSIGNACWMAENLHVSAGIPEVTDGAQWGNLTTPAWCYYGNNASNGATYGKLYNWYAVNTGNLCPSGWHIPTHDEWQNLLDYLGGDATAGGAMKDTTGWTAPNAGATNSSGFTALPGGGRSFSGNFFGVGEAATFWSSTENSVDQTQAWGRELAYNNSTVSISNSIKARGYSCRCVKD